MRVNDAAIQKKRKKRKMGYYSPLSPKKVILQQKSNAVHELMASITGMPLPCPNNKKTQQPLEPNHAVFIALLYTPTLSYQRLQL